MTRRWRLSILLLMMFVDSVFLIKGAVYRKSELTRS